MDRVPRAQPFGDAHADVLPGMVARYRVNTRPGSRLRIWHVLQNRPDVPRDTAEDHHGAVFMKGQRYGEVAGDSVPHRRDQMQLAAATWAASGKAPDGGAPEAPERNADVKF